MPSSQVPTRLRAFLRPASRIKGWRSPLRVIARPLPIATLKLLLLAKPTEAILLQKTKFEQVSLSGVPQISLQSPALHFILDLHPHLRFCVSFCLSTLLLLFGYLSFFCFKCWKNIRERVRRIVRGVTRWTLCGETYLHPMTEVILIGQYPSWLPELTEKIKWFWPR